MEIVFYISGIITALSLVAAFFYRSTYSSQQTTIKNLKRELISLREYKESRESKKRKGMLLTKGWYMTSEEKDPKRYTWNVTFELREVAQTPNSSKVQFKVIGIYSDSKDEHPMDDRTYKHYEAWFLGNFAGGWIDTKQNKGFEWVDTTFMVSASLNRSIADGLINLLISPFSCSDSSSNALTSLSFVTHFQTLFKIR